MLNSEIKRRLWLSIINGLFNQKIISEIGFVVPEISLDRQICMHLNNCIYISVTYVFNIYMFKFRSGIPFNIFELYVN